MQLEKSSSISPASHSLSQSVTLNKPASEISKTRHADEVSSSARGGEAKYSAGGLRKVLGTEHALDKGRGCSQGLEEEATGAVDVKI